MPRWSLEHEAEQGPLRAIFGMRWRLAALGISVLVGLLIVIACLQYLRGRPENLVFKAPDHHLTGLKSVYDPVLGWRNLPNYQGATRGRKLTLNSRGMRGREYDFAKPAATRRVLVLGDSYVWGYGVGDDEVFTEVLERRLQETGSPWEVINTGVPGWGTDQELLFLVEEGFKYQPDVVVLALFLGNDPENILYSKQYGLDKPVFLDTSLTPANSPVPTPRQQQPMLRTRAGGLNLMASILAKMALSCQERRCRLVVMKFGLFLREFREKEIMDFDVRLQLRARETPNLLFLDLDDAFRRRQLTQEQLLEGNYDGHWNALGHREVADVLQEVLGGAGLLGGKSPPAAR